MKRFIVSLFLGLFAAQAWANDAIKTPGIWGFGVGTTQGTYFRAIVDQANKDQKKYEFFFDHRPGAGGAIATRHALEQKGPAVLFHSGAFFIRPYLFPAETTYRFEQMRPIMIVGTAPGVLMTKGKTLDQLIKQPRIILGTAGAGSSVHLMAETLKKYLTNSEVIIVHFKDTNEAYVNVMGGHIDGAFEFLGDAKTKATAEVTFAGVTGSQRLDGIEPLKNRGMPEMEHISAWYAIFVPATTPENVYNEIRAILLKAEQSETVQSLYRRDFTFRDPTWQQTSSLQPWYDARIRRFKDITAGIKVQ